LTHDAQAPFLTAESVPLAGSTHVSVAWYVPEILHGFGLDIAQVLAAAGIRPDIFSDRENTIEYAQFHRLLLTCEQLTNCAHIGMLIGQHTRLADFGLAGRSAVCGATVGEGLRGFIDHFNLHSSATTVSLVTSGDHARLVYAISVCGLADVRQLQLGAVTMAFNILRDLCGWQWQPTAVTFASRPPSSLRPIHKFFGAPLRFNSDESAVVFERHWLDRPLPPIDPTVRMQVDADILARRAAIQADFPATVRRLLRKQLIIGESSMDDIAAMLGMHRRTLDRQLQKQGFRYGKLLEKVKEDVACQLLRDTDMQVQQIAESLHFSSAANFATAFRLWTGRTPSEFRRTIRPSAPARHRRPQEPHTTQVKYS
jgi:AraC-like DNA-binding protein